MAHLHRDISPANPVPARAPPLVRDSVVGSLPLCRNAAVAVYGSDNGVVADERQSKGPQAR
jgi:hypothetical protein